MWNSISTAFAAVGILWLAAGSVRIGSGDWVAVSLGRRRVARWVGGLATALFGLTMVGGVLTNVIPCGGPG